MSAFYPVPPRRAADWRKARINCRKGDRASNAHIFFANVWGPRPGPFLGRPQLGHGEGATRTEAIRNAKADARKNGGAK